MLEDIDSDNAMVSSVSTDMIHQSSLRVRNIKYGGVRE